MSDQPQHHLLLEWWIDLLIEFFEFSTLARVRVSPTRQFVPFVRGATPRRRESGAKRRALSCAPTQQRVPFIEPRLRKATVQSINFARRVDGGTQTRAGSVLGAGPHARWARRVCCPWRWVGQSPRGSSKAVHARTRSHCKKNDNICIQ